jgi:5-methyltetrahydrofolate--homocysteine methyltransferase
MVVVGGAEALRFTGTSGAERTCPIVRAVAKSEEYARNRVKHIKNALLLGLAGDGLITHRRVGSAAIGSAEAARDYLVAAAVRQQRAGAGYIDVNVDEIDEDLGIRRVAMQWLVAVLEPELDVPLSLDSSSAAVLEAGLRASRSASGRVLLNSASEERLEVLELAVELRAAVVLSAVKDGRVAPGVPERLRCAEAVLEAALARGLSPADCHVDLLVLPAGVDPRGGSTFLEASRAFRAAHGDEIHITGGLSNISFGLPNRRLLNDAFVALALDAGVDSGILDPVAVQLDRVQGLDRDSRQFQRAAAVVLGSDEFAGDYLAAYRAGELEPV